MPVTTAVAVLKDASGENCEQVDTKHEPASEIKEEPISMESMLAIGPDVNLKLSPPPSFSRLPPDGHEFPSNYEESEQQQTCASYAMIACNKRSPSDADVLNEAKVLDAGKKHLYSNSFDEERCSNDSGGGVNTRKSQPWRNDEKSERSVKDKIAMFTNAIVNSAPSLNGASNPSASIQNATVKHCRSVSGDNTLDKTFSRGNPSDSVENNHEISDGNIITCQPIKSATENGGHFKQPRYSFTESDVPMLDFNAVSSFEREKIESCSNNRSKTAVYDEPKIVPDKAVINYPMLPNERIGNSLDNLDCLHSGDCSADTGADKFVSKSYSKSLFSVNQIGKDTFTDLLSDANSGKCKTASSKADNTTPSTVPGALNYRTQSSIDLTLSSSSSCSSSAYSSCSPESSLSPMSSPTYVIGSASTLPRKHNVNDDTLNGSYINAGTSLSNGDRSYMRAANKDSCVNPERKKHASLTRATSFAGSTNLHCRSQSFDLLLHPAGAVSRSSEDSRKDSLASLIEQRRRTMSKLRGLVIPEKVSETIDSAQAISDLPEIKSRDCCDSTAKLFSSSKGVLDKFSSNLDDCSSENVSRPTESDNSWKFDLSAGNEIPKYSPAFKRKSLAVYASSTSSVSSSLSSSREELRTDSSAVNNRPVPPIKPPRNSLSYCTASVKNCIKQAPINGGIRNLEEKVEGNAVICRNNTKVIDDSDNDSAVSSSRSSLCHDLSPPASPVPLSSAVSEEYSLPLTSVSSDSYKTAIRRTLSSDTGTSTLSTVTSTSQLSYTGKSDVEETPDMKSRRILKAQSVEAINRKSVLCSAKYSSGQDFKGFSPFMQTIVQSSSVAQILNGSTSKEEAFSGWPRSHDSNEDVEEVIKAKEEVRIAYLEIQDADESSISKLGEENFSSSTCESDKESSGELSRTAFLKPRWDFVDAKEDKSTDEDSAELEKPAFVQKKPQRTLSTTLSSAASKKDFLTNRDRSILSSAKATLMTGGRRTSLYSRQITVPENSRRSYRNENQGRPLSVTDLRKAFERSASQDVLTVKKEPLANKVQQSQFARKDQHARMSSLDSTTSEESFVPRSPSQYGSSSNLLKDQQFGSITSLASSTSLISQQELQQLIDDANHTLEETTGLGVHDVMVVILHRDTATSSIGITLAGGADYECKEITVHKVLAGSPADRDSRIQKGDRVLSINGKSMKDVTHREALSILKAPRSEVVLVISRWKGDSSASTSPSGTKELTLNGCKNKSVPQETNKNAVISDKKIRGPATQITLKKEGGGLGFSLEGGKDSPLGDLPLTIKKIFTGGCAEKSGLLIAGDELLSLNGTDVSTMSRTEVWNLMKRLPDGDVQLTIRR